LAATPAAPVSQFLQACAGKTHPAFVFVRKTFS